MTSGEWLQSASALASKQSGATCPARAADVRRDLAETFLCLLLAPQEVQNIYVDTPEAELDRLALTMCDRLLEGDATWSVSADSLADAVRDVGVRVRALDKMLDDVSETHGRSSQPDTDYLCTEADVFVIPRTRPRRVDGVGARLHFRRRGTIYHSLIRRQMGSYTVELTVLDVLEPNPSADPQTLAAAMFENFELDSGPATGTSFRAKGIECANINEIIRGQIARALKEGCSAVVWPELTMPLAQQEALTDALHSEDEGACALQWVMAGSWHVGNEQFENVALIFDRYGAHVLKHRKSLPYRDAEHGREGLKGSFVIPVMITDEHLIAFAICKDFCEAADYTPYPDLDVDLIVVSSMGEESTIVAHQTVAYQAAVRGKRTFVVQQQGKTDVAPTGWVLPPVARPERLKINDLREGPWSTHTWDAKD